MQAAAWPGPAASLARGDRLFRGAVRAAVLALALLLTLPLAALVLGVEWADLQATLADAQVWSAIGVSLGCAAVSTAAALLLGVPLGYALAHGRLPWPALWEALVDLPVLIPHPVLGLGLLLLFARRRLLGAALHAAFGLQVASAAPGIVLAMLLVSAPFVVKAARSGFASVPARLEQAALALGASEARQFCTVSLPLAAPHIRAGAALCWARAVSEFGSVVILAYYPRTAPVLIWDRFSSRGMQAALAPSLLLAAACTGLFLLLRGLPRRAVH